MKRPLIGIFCLIPLLFLLASCAFLGTTAPPTDDSEGGGVSLKDFDMLELLDPNLIYAMNEDKAGYTVTDVRNEELTEIAIDTYKGLPVTAIADGAFSGCRFLKSVTVGDSVTSIGRSAFSGCLTLRSITLPQGITEIGDRCFYMCPALQSIVIPDGVKSIGEQAFYNCTALESLSLPSALEHVGKNAFWGVPFQGTEYENAYYYGGAENPYLILMKAKDTKITACNVHQDTKFLHDEAFLLCEELTSVTLPEGLVRIGQKCFYGCRQLREITLPQGITAIDHATFSGCVCLRTVDLPAGLLEIGSNAFSSCFSLAEISLPAGLVSIQDAAFSGSELRAITLPDSVRTLGDSAFSECDSLHDVTLGKSLESVGEYAFSYCEILSNITLRGGKTAYGYRAFYTSRLVETVEICDLAAWCQSSFASDDANPMHYADAVYLQGELLTQVNVPDGVGRIPAYGFTGCESITHVVIPDSVTEIEAEAFNLCSELAYVKIGKGVAKMGRAAFCFAYVDEVHICDLKAWCSIDFYDWDSNPLSTGAALVLNGTPVSSFSPPAGITEIKSYAFYGCDSLESVTLPAGVTYIGKEAFSLCTSLKTVTVGADVSKIDYKAFADSYELENIYLQNPNGWHMYRDGLFPTAELADPKKAAEYFTDTYCQTAWERGPVEEP